MKELTAFFFIFFVNISTIYCQISFENKTKSLLRDTNFISSYPIGIVDVNGDGLDDIVRINYRNYLQIEYQNKPNTMFSSNLVGKTSSYGSEWSLCVADVDKNGYNDLLIGGRNNGLKLYKANDDGDRYDKILLEDLNIFAQGQNFVDINQDGYVDVFACNDDGLSISYRNNYFGGFIYDSTLINTKSSIPSDNSGNYGSVWTDYDNDNDLDLYISKCRGGVADKLDGRRVNLLFQNDGKGNYKEVAQEANLIPYEQSWAADFADIDNDGDMDCFVLNHYAPSIFYVNNGDGTFSNVNHLTGVSYALQSNNPGYQAIFKDFDNDGFIDLLAPQTTGNNDPYIFRNKGNLTFEVIPFPIPNKTNRYESVAVGDLNNDGLLDIYNIPVYEPREEFDRVLINTSDSKNNYLKVLLKGTVSNINGVGAKIRIYGPWGIQVREVRSGESYGIMNSFTQHFGLGSTMLVDSLLIEWPSGYEQKLCGIGSNQTINIVEGQATSFLESDFEFSKENLSVSFISTSKGRVTQWLWDFGDGNQSSLQNPTHIYKTGGNYKVKLKISNECEYDESELFNVLVHPSDDSAILIPNPSSDVVWLSTGITEIESLLIYNSQGSIVYQEYDKPNELFIDVSSWQSGIYYISIKKQGMKEVKTLTFVKS